METGLQKASDAALQSVAASETALRKLEEGLAVRTIDAAIKAPTLAMAIKEIGEQDTYIVLTAAVFKGVLYFTPEVQPDPDQVTLFADYIYDQHKLEGLADLSVFFRKAAMGDFGETDEKGKTRNKGKTFGRLDAKKLKEWWMQYLDQKIARMEDQAKYYGNDKMRDLFGNEVLAPIMKEAVQQQRSERAQNDMARRLDFLRKHVPNMSVEELRESWKIYRSADERKIIFNEAVNVRKLEMKKSDERSAETTTDQP
jgi:hypothetical protein